VDSILGFFQGAEHYSGPPVSDEAVRAAEEKLGYRLPASYIALLHERNGGEPRRQCFPTTFLNSWAPDHIAISAILGVGQHAWGIDSGFGSRHLIREWGYPDIGVVICDTPSGGHDTVMLDYSASGPAEEPSVVYIDEDRVPRQLARSFSEFVEELRPCDDFPVE
jgi:hypothetical protein